MFSGRRIFWLAVAIVGFLAGSDVASVTLADHSEPVVIVVAFAAGILGALVALLAERLAFALIGFSAGGYLGLAVVEQFAVPPEALLFFVTGAVIGTIVALAITDWAIVVLTSLVGAAAVVSTLGLQPPITSIVLVLLAALGIFAQSVDLRRFAARAPR